MFEARAWLAAVVLVATPLRAEHGFFDRLSVPAVGHEVRIEKSVMVPMRDGVQLSTDLYLPKDVEGVLPVVLMRTPYGKNVYRAALNSDAAAIEAGPVPKGNWSWEAVFLARHGYAVVVQDHRGRHESEGVFLPYPATDGRDGYDTISWIVRQPWSNGKVGTIGCSYLGETQHMLAARRHPNHTTAIAEAGSSSVGAGGVWNFGFTRYGVTELAAALNWNFGEAGHFSYGPPPGMDRQQWFRSDHARWYRPAPVMPSWQDPGFGERVQRALHTLPVIDAMQVLGEGPVPSAFENWIRHADEPRGVYWSQQGLITESDRFDIPALHVNSWYDITPNSTLRLFEQFARNAESRQARDHQYLIMGAGTHCGHAQATRQAIVGDRPLGDAYLNFPAIYLAWFDYWLKGEANGITRMPKVSSFALGRNRWRTGATWPLAGVRPQKWFLSSDGSANTRHGNGRLALHASRGGARFDAYRYDPTDPTPSVGGSICCTGPEVKSGGIDQREVELRKDVLVYSSAPLERAVEVAGAISAVLQVSSDAKDTDFVAKLVDVYPDGTAYIVQEGVLRARWRDGFASKVFMAPEQIYEVRIDLEATHNYFAAGHRIRLDISSSSFPRWDRNLNTGGSNYDEQRSVIANNRVHHLSGNRSYLQLFVLPESE